MENEKKRLLQQTREASGCVSSSNTFVEFLYLLMRDHLPTGTVAGIVQDIAANSSGGCNFTNGWLANYAIHLETVLKTKQIKSKTLPDNIVCVGQNFQMDDMGRIWDKRIKDPLGPVSDVDEKNVRWFHCSLTKDDLVACGMLMEMWHAYVNNNYDNEHGENVPD